MPIEIKRLDEESTRFLTAVIYGSSGSGKTWLAGTANLDERTSPCLFLDFEGGAEAAQGMDLQVIHITTADDFDDVAYYLKTEEHPYKSVVIDSLSEAHVRVLHDQLEDARTARANKKINPYLLQQGDYGVAAVHSRVLVNTFRDLPMHVIFTSLTKDDSDPIRGHVKKLAIPGKLADELPGVLNLMAYLTVTEHPESKQAVRTLILQNYSSVLTKVRRPPNVEVPDEIYEPTMTKLLDALAIK